MKKKIIFLFVCNFLFGVLHTYAQSVAISGYFNATDPRDEWTELIVITDNTDMRNWTMRDNNASQNSWQTAVTFQNISFWQNLRAGTIIMLWSRPVASDGTTVHPSDLNASDGYIELNLTNSSYFSGGSFGSSPSWAGNTMNIAGSGEVLQLRDGSATHVHALGHKTTVGTDWTNLPSPKLNHANTASSGDAIYVSPGGVAADYDGPATGNLYTSRNSSTLSFGLPNESVTSPATNIAYWDTLREPVFSLQTVGFSSYTPGSPGSLTFSWTAATDPNPSDNTTGYMILRNLVNSFTHPDDGTSYTVGSTIGSSDVVGIITSSSTSTFTDNTAFTNAYYYRIYAFRYGNDDVNGNSYNRARGRAYNIASYGLAQDDTPLPIELVDFTAKKLERTVELKWETASETNNDFFTIERSSDGHFFSALIKVKAVGDSYETNFYTTTDNEPLEGISYYRLRQTDYDGSFTYSDIRVVDFEAGDNQFAVFPNPFDRQLFVQTDISNEGEYVVRVMSMTGQLVFFQKYSVSDVTVIGIDLSFLSAGVYVLEFISEQNEYRNKIVKL